jgi:hypothetical protein
VTDLTVRFFFCAEKYHIMGASVVEERSLSPATFSQQPVIVQTANYSPYSGGNNYSSNVGLDLKRHVEEQSMGSPSSPGDQDSLQEPDVKRSRHEQPQYDTE